MHNNKFLSRFMALAAFASMVERNNPHNKHEKEVKEEKPLPLKTCPLCGVEHYNKSRYCCESHKIEYKAILKEKREQRKNRKKKRFHR